MRTIRYFGGDLEIRQADEGVTTVAGYAAVFFRANDPGTEFEMLGEVRERIMPGAFDRALAERQDVRGLFNHDPSNLLGRTGSGTLRLETNKRGLRYEIDLPDTTVGRDVRESISRGDLTGSSFGFVVRADKWASTDDGEIREVHDVDLYDVGPVTYPAYRATTSGLRDEFVAECRDSLKAWKERLQAEREAQLAEWGTLDARARVAQL